MGPLAGPTGLDGYDTPQAVTGITDAVSVVAAIPAMATGSRLLCGALDRRGGLLGGQHLRPAGQRDHRERRHSPGGHRHHQRLVGIWGQRRRRPWLLCGALNRRGGLLGEQRLRPVGQRDYRWS